MALDPLKIAIKGTTQDHLPIEDVIDGVVLRKDGSCSIIMRISSVNFDLLSEREQQALVFAYGGILNSLNFPIQIIIQSNTKDVSAYSNNLKVWEEKQNNPLLKERIASYRKFVEEIVKKNDVLSKTFYIAIPFSALELGATTMSKQIVDNFMFFKNKTTTELPYPKDYIIEKAKASLEPKREHLLRLFSRLGLEIKALETKEIIELFYKIYNEESAGSQKIRSTGFDSPIVTIKK
ncbi:MAG TPA: hypothetical protein PK370_03165 [Candidatus Woesebacteria bacterium]|nr:hypothetical protein [Candidatus Woesebacteria bacterium]HPJ17340.1 hypothetical protein [Candidatus Woesebacteria bacterium]